MTAGRWFLRARINGRAQHIAHASEDDLLLALRKARQKPPRNKPRVFRCERHKNANRPYLMCDVRARVCNVPSSLRQYSLMFVAVQQSVLGFSLSPVSSTRGRANTVCFQTRLFKYNEQPTLGRRRGSSSHPCLRREHGRIRKLLRLGLIL